MSFQNLEEFYGGDVVIQKTDVKSSTIKNPQIIAKTKEARDFSIQSETH